MHFQNKNLDLVKYQNFGHINSFETHDPRFPSWKSEFVSMHFQNKNFSLENKTMISDIFENA